MYRLVHRRKLHLLTYIFTLTTNISYLRYIDDREIHARNHAAPLFNIVKPEHFKDRQQLAGHDSRYITLLCGHYIYNIILYIKL